MDILYFQVVRPFRLGGWNHHGHPLLPSSKGYDPLGWGGETIMDILYFQGVRPFRLGGNHHGHPLLIPLLTMMLRMRMLRRADAER